MTPQTGCDGPVHPMTDQPLDESMLDTIIDSLLSYQPPPHVIALNEHGLAVPMPAQIPVAAGKQVEGAGSALEVCVPADMPIVIEAFKHALRLGGANAVVHLPVAPQYPITLHFVDARHRYGVYLGIFVGIAGAVEGSSARASLFRPRLCTLERDGFGVVLAVDDATTRILGWNRAELVGASTLELLHPDDRLPAIAGWMEALARAGLHQRGLFRYRHKDGSYVWFETTHLNELANPARKCVISQLVDVTDRMEAIEALRANEQLLRRLTEALPIGIVQIDAQRRIVYRNERLGEIVGISTAGTIAEQFALLNAADRDELEAALLAVFSGGAAADIELTLDHPDGARRCSVGMRALTTEAGAVSGAIACVTDITEGVHLREELETRATFDNLTRCRNRAAILETLEAMLQCADRPQTGTAVLFVDLDRFKEVNDHFGHAAGDALLRCVGERLLHGARDGDVVGRLGGDEFLIVCPDVDTPQSALDIARRIAVSLAQRAVIGAQSFVPSSSIGVAWTATPVDADTLVARADVAMYESKRRADGPVLFQAAKPALGRISPE